MSRERISRVQTFSAQHAVPGRPRPVEVGSKAPASLGTLYEAVWRIERDLDLLNRSASGIFYWPLIRPRLVDLLSARLGLHDLVSPRLRHSFLERAAREIRDFLQTFRPFAPRPSVEAETIVVTHPRKQLRGNELVDIYCDRLLREIGLGSCLVLDSGSDAQLYRAAPGRSVENRDGLRAMALLRASVRLVPSILALVRDFRDLDAAVLREFGFGCPLSLVHLAFKVGFFDEVRRSARRLMRKSGAKTLFVTGGRDTAALVAAAQDVGLETIELQHGLLSRYHPVYHFPGRPHVPYAPNRMLTFGSFWASNIDLPGNTRVLVIGSQNLADVRAQQNRRVARRVFVVSQGAIGGKLFEIAIRAARGAPDWSFVFGPHPQENRKTYQQRLASLPGLENFSVAASQGEFYGLLAGADVQVGVYSTALFEGMALGVRTIVMMLPGAEHMAGVIEQGEAALARDAEELIALLPTAPRARDAERYFATPAASMMHVMSAEPPQRSAPECLSNGLAG